MHPNLSRENFVCAATGEAALAPGALYAAPKNALPRRRGFNLLYFFQARNQRDL